jgi:hypothetical protein
LFDAFYFIIMSAYGYNILSKTEFLPWILGGKATNKWSDIFSDFPVLTKPYAQDLKYYYLFSLGYHIKSFYVLLSENRVAQRHDLKEMFLHHFAVICL